LSTSLVRVSLLFTALIVLESAAPSAHFRAAFEPCAAALQAPRLISISGSLGKVVIDSACHYAFVSNTTLNRVEIISLDTLSRQNPVQVGSSPIGMDLTADESALYVANSGGNNISVVDLGSRTELRKINVPPNFSNDRPYSIAIASNGLAIFSTTFSGSGFGARVMQLELATDAVSHRTELFLNSSTTEQTRLNASGDRTVIGLEVGDDSGGPVFSYNASTNSFSSVKRLNTFLADIGVNGRGTVLLALGTSAYVLGADLSLLGTFPGTQFRGGTIDWGGTVGYRTVGSNVEVLNLRTFLKVRDLPLGDTTNTAFNTNNFIGHMDLSADGRLLAVITDHGVSLVPTNAITFTDDPLLPNVTPVKAVHITELRTLIDAARAVRGLPPFSWNNSSLTGTLFLASNILELRTALAQAYVAASIGPPSYTDAALTSTTVIKAVHIMELRAAVRALQ